MLSGEVGLLLNMSIFDMKELVVLTVPVLTIGNIYKTFVIYKSQKMTVYYEIFMDRAIVKVINKEQVFTYYMGLNGVITKIELGDLKVELENMVKSMSGGENRESFFG